MPIIIKYYVHGTTIDNEVGNATGWNEGELSELGITQTKGIAKKVRSENFDMVISSDLKRAVQSTKLIFEKQTVKIMYEKK